MSVDPSDMVEVQRGYDLPAVGDVRLTTPHPLGGRATQVDGIKMAELGALVGARGAEKGAMTSLLQELQAATLQSWITHLPSILGKFRNWEVARLNRLMQRVRSLPEAAPPPGILSRVTGVAGTPVSLVSRDQVLQLIAVLMEEAPVIE